MSLDAHKRTIDRPREALRTRGHPWMLDMVGGGPGESPVRTLLVALGVLGDRIRATAHELCFWEGG